MFGLLGIDFAYGFDNADPSNRTPNGWETHFTIGQQFKKEIYEFKLIFNLFFLFI